MSTLGPYAENTIAQGHVLDVLRELLDGCVHCCITSPPYWGLRDYGTEPQVWGGEEGCQHVWGEELPAAKQSHTNEGFAERVGAQYRGGGHSVTEVAVSHRPTGSGQFCSLCSAWRGSLGLEPSPDLYVQHLVEIFREVRRVLREDGTLWLNISDSFASGLFVHGYRRNVQSGSKWHTLGEYRTDGGSGKRDIGNVQGGRVDTEWNLKPKDQCLIPFRLAIALQNDGWYIRQTIIWAKGISFCPTYSGSCMPESVRDRPTQSYEYVFLMAKSKRYFYDQGAIKEDSASGPSDIKKMLQSKDRIGGKHKILDDPLSKASKATNIGRKRAVGSPLGRNLRSVWAINPQPWPGSHFAVFPERLVEPCVLAGTSERGVCPECGSPWERILEKTDHGFADRTFRSEHETGTDWNTNATGATTLAKVIESRTLGWRPTCDCQRGDTIPAIVLDPFCGSGTTPKVALELRRHYLGIDLSGEYVEMAQQRIAEVQPRLL